MDKYFISEESGKEQNALTKARQDANKILESDGWKALNIHRKNPEQNKLFHYVRMFFWTNVDWIKISQKIKHEAVLCIQFPFLNSLLYNRLAAKYIERLKKKKNIKVVLLIHDIDSIRFPQEAAKQYSHEKVFWNLSDVIIAHNNRMKEYLLEQNVKSHIITLQVFDYVGDLSVVPEDRRDGSIVIAGNLDGSKAGYLRKLKNIKDCNFSLYGPGFDKQMEADNLIYRGAYPPDRLAENIQGSWGLVWDGVSTDTCTGAYGEYLRYNNPHKVSLYVAIGMPVIVWRQSAISEFVETKKIGISLNSLEEMGDMINQISELEYNRMVENLEKLSVELRGGEFLKRALKESTDLFMN